MFLKNGFTLIELLVVIAIIGILASVVLVSFPSATKKANDARVQAAISQMRVLLASYQSTNGSYTGFACDPTPNPPEMANLCADVVAKGYGGANPTIEISATGDEACIYTPLNVQDGNTWYCADSAGIAGVTATNPNDVNGCDGTTFVCPAGTSL